MNKIGLLILATVMLLLTVSTLNSVTEALRYQERYKHYQTKYLSLLANYSTLQDDYIQTLIEYGSLQDKYIMLAQGHVEFIDNLTVLLDA